MTLLDRYEIERNGATFVVEVMQHDEPKPTAPGKLFYAYVSDQSEAVVRTRDVQKEATAREAAVKAIKCWGFRTRIDYSQRPARKANVPTDKLLRIIADDPGAGLVSIAKALGKLNGTVEKWLQRMKLEGLLRIECSAVGERGRKRWFVTEAGAERLASGVR